MVQINKNTRELPSWTPRVEYKGVGVGMKGERTTDVCKCALAMLPTHQLWMNVVLSLPRPFDFLIAACFWSVMNLKKTSTTKKRDVLLCL